MAIEYGSRLLGFLTYENAISCFRKLFLTLRFSGEVKQLFSCYLLAGMVALQKIHSAWMIYKLKCLD
ncbi:hypothetical protein AHMF7616_04855 [Adhaeribacter pallidiroseus]|uniref:Uncharacterized protein n=1 Tax=Adhaeribacter pallidiroseus TaxID=2072847 RepID=A0A369QN99_9BACT|nr:hypothetical protein AHMF7616_04855 [Adhaeribacter pallidiroseus]